MKNLILASVVALFGFTTAHAAPTDTTEEVKKEPNPVCQNLTDEQKQDAAFIAENGYTQCIDVAQAVKDGQSEKDILSQLESPMCGMSACDAINTIVAAGGDLVYSLAAALIDNPDLGYFDTCVDPTANLEPTASGGEGEGGDSVASNNGGAFGAGGGFAPVSP